jgi:carbamoyltransferase
MDILSIHTSHHDANYCILKDGLVNLHNEVERFTRIKHDGKFQEGFAERFTQTLENSDIFSKKYDHVCWVYARNEGILTHLDISKLNGSPKIHYIGHHTSHASSAFYNSNFNDALIFSIDGGGEEIIIEGDDVIWTAYSNCIFLGENNQIKSLSNSKTLFSIGVIWTTILESIFGMGTVFDPRGDESGTLMAMSAFGDPYKYLEEFRPLLQDDLRTFRIDYLKKEIDEDPENKFHIAAALQRFTEDYLMNYVIMNLDRSETKNICFTGGVSLNCVALGKVAKALIEKGYNVFCDRAPNDSGLSLGAAKYLWHHILDNPRNIDPQNSYLGRTYSESEIRKSIKNKPGLFLTENVGLSNIVELLMGSKIISLFNEGSESGKRALGNRSIVADPRFSFMKNFVNEKVKHRKGYRPFAPSVLREHVSDWFDLDIDSPYMSFAIPVKEDKRNLVPAILHHDNTARLQTVTSKENGYYYDLISLFYEKTGVPMLLNTSFNNQEPIVETPKNALDCFFNTNIDYLYFVREKILISKENKN